ncbi:MAG TPA: hypothetical protein VEO74_11615 [Thermoanaerobaculia bacterium]|nr:hypothetical protein [Thermoanaerobaculia bacterium]
MPAVKTLEVWTAQTICNAGILLSLVSCFLHIGRPYFERILSRLTLRVAADLWWLTYVALRDGSLFVAAILGLWTLNLDLMADIKIGLPFVPMATVLLCVTLLLKVFGDVPERRILLLVTGAASLNLVGYAVVMEAPGREYQAANTIFWKTMLSLRSNANPELSTATFYIACALLAVMAVAALARAGRV